MIEKLILLFNLFLFISVGILTKLPSSFKKCNRKQSDCLITAVQNAIQQLNEPIPEVGLPNLKPLFFGNLTVSSGTSMAHFERNYYNYRAFGLTALNVTKFDVFFENKTINMQCEFKQIRTEFDYDFSGKIFLVPLQGKGPGKMTFSDVTLFITFFLEEYENKGKKYLKVINTALNVNTRGIKFELKNLFQKVNFFGFSYFVDVNPAFDQNWKLIFSEEKTNYESHFARTFSLVFNSLLEKVSVDELFDEEY